MNDGGAASHDSPPHRRCSTVRVLHHRVSEWVWRPFAHSVIGHGDSTLISPVSDLAVTLLAVTHALFGMSAGAQLLTEIPMGAMKSLISEVKLLEERLFRYACPKL